MLNATTSAVRRLCVSIAAATPTEALALAQKSEAVADVLEIRAGAERAARAGEYDYARGAIDCRGVERGDERFQHLHVDRVEPVGPVESQGAHALAHRDQHFVRHGILCLKA